MKGFADHLYCSGNDQAGEENPDESYQYSDYSSCGGLHGDIAVADSKPCDKREVQCVPKGNLLCVGNAHGAEQNPEKHQNDERPEKPHDSKEIEDIMEKTHSLISPDLTSDGFLFIVSGLGTRSRA